MPGKGPVLMAEQTRKLRLEMHRLVTNGMAEQKALLEIFPQDSNRARRLKVWKEKGLWPIPKTELEKLYDVEHSITAETSPQRLQSDKTPSLSDVDIVERCLPKESFEKRAREILDNIETKKYEWTGKGKVKENKTAILAGRMPLDLVQGIKALEGKVTDHMEKALRLYLKIVKAGE